jgi:hypothetical protein
MWKLLQTVAKSLEPIVGSITEDNPCWDILGNDD